MAIVNIYYRLVKDPDSAWTIEDVPVLWREEVQVLLDADEQGQIQ